MKIDKTAPPAVDALVDAIMQSYGQLALILDHMQRYRSAPDAEPIPDVLRDLLRGVLGQMADRHGPDDVATAAQMLSAATDAIGGELYFVPPSRAERRAARRQGCS
jgi:hypothetical protein